MSKKKKVDVVKGLEDWIIYHMTEDSDMRSETFSLLDAELEDYDDDKTLDDLTKTALRTLTSNVLYGQVESAIEDVEAMIQRNDDDDVLLDPSDIAAEILERTCMAVDVARIADAVAKAYVQHWRG